MVSLCRSWFAFNLIFQIFYDNKFTSHLIKLFESLIILYLFLIPLALQLGGILGHAPWSDAYESIIFVAGLL